MLPRFFARTLHNLHCSPNGLHRTAHTFAYQSKSQSTDADRILSFSELAIHQQVKTYLTSNFPTPTEIQAATMKPILNGDDVIGVAKTGSGKTLAFGIPGLIHINKKRLPTTIMRQGPVGLIMSPTRQLAKQICEHLLPLNNIFKSKIACVYGGADKHSQTYSMRQGVDLLVATPGRLNDFLNSGALKLGRVSYVVLDEADRMLDIGFEPQIRQIMSRIDTSKTQTLMFSATFDKEIQSLAHSFMKPNFKRVQIGSSDITLNKDIEQQFILVKFPKTKPDSLNQLLATNPDEKIIIFCNTKWACNSVSDLLKEKKISHSYLSGDLSQSERQYNLRRFKEDKNRILIATDVAARGLDIKNVNIVLNYDLPATASDYVHRIGRTGRAGQKGRSITFLTMHLTETHTVQGLIKLFHKSGIPIPTYFHQYDSSRTSRSRGRSSNQPASRFGFHDNQSQGRQARQRRQPPQPRSSQFRQSRQQQFRQPKYARQSQNRGYSQSSRNQNRSNRDVNDDGYSGKQFKLNRDPMRRIIEDDSDQY